MWTIKRSALMFFLWLAFTAGCLASPIVVPLLPFVRRHRYSFFVLCAADRLMAALLGFSGRVTLSAELAHSNKYPWLRDSLNRIEPNHCEESAYSEGVYCRLSDRTLGHK